MPQLPTRLSPTVCHAPAPRICLLVTLSSTFPRSGSSERHGAIAEGLGRVLQPGRRPPYSSLHSCHRPAADTLPLILLGAPVLAQPSGVCHCLRHHRHHHLLG
ncbi:hypothetical protein VTI74DRAFT_7655 [Chaetomium olivicolor]